VWIENDELMAGITGIDDVRQVLRQVLRFVLSRGSIGEIECDGSTYRDDHGSHKSSGKAQRSNVAVVQEGQENRGDYGQGKTQDVTLQIDRFPWLTLHIRRALSDDSSALASVSLHRVAWSILECARRMSTFQFSTPLSRGVAKVALDCAHRATTVSSWGLCEQEGHLAAPSHLYFTRNGLEFSPEAVVTVRSTKPFFPPLGTVVAMPSSVC